MMWEKSSSLELDRNREIGEARFNLNFSLSVFLRSSFGMTADTLEMISLVDGDVSFLVLMEDCLN